MNTLDELAQEIARHWDGEVTARNLVCQYSEEKGLPLWMYYGDFEIQQADINELIELVNEELYDCEPVRISKIGKPRPIWI